MEQHRRSTSRRQAVTRFNFQTRVMVLGILLAALMMMLSACNNEGASSARVAPGESISIDEFPQELGRGFAAVSLDQIQSRPLAQGQLAPDFRLQLNDGRTVTLAELQGRPVMLNFWATWCGPCRLEMPDIVAAGEEHGDLVVVAINVREELETVIPFVQEFGMSMPVAMDTEGALQQRYSVNGMPTSVFIDRDGNVAGIWTGLITKERLEQMLAFIL